MRVLAFDFDKTMVSEHTAVPYWRGPLHVLASKVRPLFRQMIPLAIQHGILISVVTNNRRVKMIADTMQIAFPEIDTSVIVFR